MITCFHSNKNCKTKSIKHSTIILLTMAHIEELTTTDVADALLSELVINHTDLRNKVYEVINDNTSSSLDNLYDVAKALAGSQFIVKKIRIYTKESRKEVWTRLIAGHLPSMIITPFFNAMFPASEIKISTFAEMANKKDLTEEVTIPTLSIVDGFDMKFSEVEHKLISSVLSVCRKVIFINNPAKDYSEQHAERIKLLTCGGKIMTYINRFFMKIKKGVSISAVPLIGDMSLCMLINGLGSSQTNFPPARVSFHITYDVKSRTDMLRIGCGGVISNVFSFDSLGNLTVHKESNKHGYVAIVMDKSLFDKKTSLEINNMMTDVCWEHIEQLKPYPKDYVKVGLLHLESVEFNVQQYYLPVVKRKLPSMFTAVSGRIAGNNFYSMFKDVCLPLPPSSLDGKDVM